MRSMENGDKDHCIFPLTSLQIGDLQSYLSHLHLFTAADSGKLFVLVDNRPWLEDLVSRPTHLWQLMVTKSRLSPFANTRGRKGKKMMGEFLESQASSSSETRKYRNFKRWFTLIDVVSRKRAMLPVKKLRNSLIANSKLHRTLYGFIIFEVAWKDVRGINYFNELQTDTSLAIESKVMRRWEFDSIVQAVSSISSWFPGTLNEQIILKEHLDDIIGEVFYDAQESFLRTNEADIVDIIANDIYAGDESPYSLGSSIFLYPATMENQTSRFLTPPPPSGPYKRRKVTRAIYSDSQIVFSSEDTDPRTVEILDRSPDPNDSEETLEPSLYQDVLILFRFNDRDLPFKVRDIIMADLRLLTLLEAGLPAWVVFLQSYPIFCHIYRPWMCPLVRALYVLISIVTVLIGFYDLYKNVPLLKETASKLFGPLFDWIETLEMISRIKYLGTMLFLHNFQKAINWFLTVTRSIRSVLTFLAKPMAGPVIQLVEFILPVWSVFANVAGSFFSITWMILESLFSIVGDLMEFLLLPLWYILALVWNVSKLTATSVLYPVFWTVGEILYASFRLVLRFCNFVALFCTHIYQLVVDLWRFLRSFFNFTREVESAVISYEVSMWRSLWNDLFYQVFRALRSILNGLAAFFMACNRHRLSIYNHMKEFNHKLRSGRRASIVTSSQSVQTSEAPVSPGGRKEVPHLLRSQSIFDDIHINNRNSKH